MIPLVAVTATRSSANPWLASVYAGVISRGSGRDHYLPVSQCPDRLYHLLSTDRRRPR